MSVIVSQGRFGLSDAEYKPLQDVADLQVFKGSLDVPSDTHPDVLVPHLSRIDAVRIDFPAFSDGRGNSIAKALRVAGYRGPMRARGHVIADQYPLAIRCGFDEVEIDETLAKRQPEKQWRDAFKRLQGTYLERLRSEQQRRQKAA